MSRIAILLILVLSFPLLAQHSESYGCRFLEKQCFDCNVGLTVQYQDNIPVLAVYFTEDGGDHWLDQDEFSFINNELRFYFGGKELVFNCEKY